METTHHTTLSANKLNLPAYGCTVKSAFSIDVIGQVSPEIVMKLAQKFCPTSYKLIKDLPKQVDKISQKLIEANFTPTRDFMGAVFWIHKLVDSGQVERINNQKHNLRQSETVSEFLFRVLVEDIESFLQSVNFVSNHEASIGKRFVLFGRNDGRRNSLAMKQNVEVETLRAFCLDHFKDRYGNRLRLSLIIKKDIIGFTVERGTQRKNAAKIDSSESVVDRDDRDIKVDIVFYHGPSQCIWVYGADKDLYFYSGLLGNALFGIGHPFKAQQTFSTKFLHVDKVEDLLESSKTERMKKVYLRAVLFSTTGLNKLKVDVRASKPKQCLGRDKLFLEQRRKFPKADYVKLQAEISGEKNTFDSIEIFESAIKVGDILGIEHSLALLTKLGVVGRFDHA